jgi:hypothetical protein
MVNGTVKVTALIHSMLQETILVSTQKKNGSTKSKTVLTYAGTVGTLLTLKNLCWVEKSSGVDLPDVDCPRDE